MLQKALITKREDELIKARKNHEAPSAISRLGWRYHHLGIPTTVPHTSEQHLKHLKVFVRGFRSSPFGIEWMRFEPDCKVNDLIRRIPHVAFEVDNIDKAIRGHEIIYPISSPSKGVRSAMIVHDGAPIELIEFKKITRTKKKKTSGAA